MFRGKASKGSVAARDLARDGALASGWLMKQGEGNKAFKKRFSVLRHTASFSYYKGDGDTLPLKSVDASNYVAVRSHNAESKSGASSRGPGGGFPFTLEPVDGSGETRVFTLEAPTAEERTLWLSAFSKANVNIDAEIARARKELGDRHSVTMSRKADEFKEAESRIKAELAAVSTSLTDERAHRMELETLCNAQRELLFKVDARLADLYNEVEAGDTATAVPARPLLLEELKSDNGEGGMVIHHKLSTHLMDLLSKLRASSAIGYAMHRVDKKQKKSSARRGAGRDTTRHNHPSRNRVERSPIRSHDTNGGSPVPVNPGDDGDTPSVAAPSSPEPSQTNDSAASPRAMVAQARSSGGVTTDPVVARQQTAGSASDTALSHPSPGESSMAAISRPASPPRQQGLSDSQQAVDGGRTSGHDMGKAATPVSRRQAFRAAKLRQQAIEAGWDSSDTEAAGNMRSSRRRASSMRSSALPPVEETKTDLQRLQEFYTIYDPAKACSACLLATCLYISHGLALLQVREAPSILLAFKGREAALWRLVEEKYKRSVHGVQPTRNFLLGSCDAADDVSVAGRSMSADLFGTDATLAASLAGGDLAGDTPHVAGGSSHTVTSFTQNVLAEAVAEDPAGELARAVPPQWIRDDHARACQICMEKFSFSRRRHHCRRCGRCICGDCAPSELSKRIPEFGYFKPVRHCRDCFGL